MFYASYAFVRFSNHSIHPLEGSDLLTVDANLRALEKMAEGVKTGFTILSLLMGKLTLNISRSSKETNLKFVHIIFAFWVVSFFKSPMLQGAEESNLFYDVTLGHFYSEQDV